MAAIKTNLVGRAAKSTAKLTARNTASRLRQKPLRTGTLLGLGCAMGFLAGRLTGRPDRALSD